MMKWFLRIILLIILLVGLAIAGFIWLVMANALQEMVDDNLTALRQDLIFEDRNLSFDHQGLGVEMKGFFQPAVTLAQPRIILKHGAYEYRLTAPEVSVIGSYTQLKKVTIQAPPKVQLTIKQQNRPPRILSLELPGHLRLSLQTDGGESHMWQRHQLPENLSGKIKVKDENSGTQARVEYSLLRIAGQPVGAPYSQHLLPVLQKFSAVVSRP